MRLFKDFNDLTMYSKEDQYVREVSQDKIIMRPSSQVHQIMTIPRLAERMKCMVFRRKFEMDVAECRPQLQFLHRACHELRHASKFQKVLQVCRSNVYRTFSLTPLRLFCISGIRSTAPLIAVALVVSNWIRYQRSSNAKRQSKGADESP